MSPILKPRQESKRLGSNLGLPSNRAGLTSFHPRESGTKFDPSLLLSENEDREYLAIYGRLLMMPIIWREMSIAFDKQNHDSGRFDCEYRWPICNCKYAISIRNRDIGI